MTSLHVITSRADHSPFDANRRVILVAKDFLSVWQLIIPSITCAHVGCHRWRLSFRWAGEFLEPSALQVSRCSGSTQKKAHHGGPRRFHLVHDRDRLGWSPSRGLRQTKAARGDVSWNCKRSVSILVRRCLICLGAKCWCARSSHALHPARTSFGHGYSERFTALERRATTKFMLPNVLGRTTRFVHGLHVGGRIPHNRLKPKGGSPAWARTTIPAGSLKSVGY